MGAAGVDLANALRLQCLDCIHESTGAIDLIIDYDGPLALHVTDNAEQLALAGVADPTLLDDGQRGFQKIRKIPGAPGVAQVANDDGVVPPLGDEVVTKDADGLNSSTGTLKKP